MSQEENALKCLKLANQTATFTFQINQPTNMLQRVKSAECSH